MGNSREVAELCPPACRISFSARVALHQPTHQCTRHTGGGRLHQSNAVPRGSFHPLGGKTIGETPSKPDIISTNTYILVVGIIKETHSDSTPRRTSPPRLSNAWINLDRRRMRNKNTDWVTRWKMKIGGRKLRSFWQDPGHQNQNDCVGLTQQQAAQWEDNWTDCWWSLNLKQD